MGYLVKSAAFAVFLALGGGAAMAQSALPELLRDMPANAYEADKLFKERVRAAFPKAVSLANLDATLTEMGFETYGMGMGMAELTRESGSCVQNWTITWAADGDTATGIDGLYNAMC